MSLYGDSSPFHIVLHEYDSKGQCTYVDVVGHYTNFDDAVLVYSKLISNQWVAVDARTDRYDFELVECSPMSLYHPHGCTPRVSAKQSEEGVHAITVNFNGETLLTSP